MPRPVPASYRPGTPAYITRMANGTVTQEVTEAVTTMLKVRRNQIRRHLLACGFTQEQITPLLKTAADTVAAQYAS